MTRTLDDDLAAAAPLVRERTPEFRAALRELIADTDKQAHQGLSASQRRRRFAAVVWASAALLGTGTTAAAAGWVPSPWWKHPEATTQSVPSTAGQECSVTYAPRPVNDPAHPVADVDRAAAMRSAAKFLRNFDFTAVATENPDIIFNVLNKRLTEALRQQGLPADAVSVAVTYDCPNGGNK
jgi:hypothetical protein